MAQWKHAVDFSAFWHDESMTIQEKGKQVATRLRNKFELFAALEPDLYQEAIEIAEAFEFVEDVEEFDDNLYSLYEWADQRLWGIREITNMCWINTMPKPQSQEGQASVTTE